MPRALPHIPPRWNDDRLLRFCGDAKRTIRLMLEDPDTRRKFANELKALERDLDALEFPLLMKTAE